MPTIDTNNVFNTLVKNPMSVFIILSAIFGYLYYEQNQRLQAMLTEVGMLRAELSKMHEIIKLKVELAESKCKEK